MFDELVVIVPGEVLDIRRGSSNEVVNADDPEPFREQAVGEV
ncbi:MAG: hypothetical protein QM796_16510 [Chthoniobacteraceae bacterium]